LAWKTYYETTPCVTDVVVPTVATIERVVPYAATEGVPAGSLEGFTTNTVGDPPDESVTDATLGLPARFPLGDCGEWDFSPGIVAGESPASVVDDALIGGPG
jgi:hypothetical protein